MLLTLAQLSGFSSLGLRTTGARRRVCEKSAGRTLPGGREKQKWSLKRHIYMFAVIETTVLSA